MTYYPGLLVTIEGCEGVGKTTQSGLLANFIAASYGLSVIRTREPGGTPGAEAIRELLLTGVGDRWDGITELMLFLAARRDHLQRVIVPHIAKPNGVVVCDRFSDTTLAYQGYGRDVNREMIIAANHFVCGFVRPDLTIVLDGDVGTGLARSRAARGSVDRFEAADTSFHDAARRGFREIASQNPHRCRLVGVDDRSIEEVQSAVAATFADWLSGRT